MREIAIKGSLKNVKGIQGEIKRIFPTALDIELQWHVKMQAAFQKYTDNAVSKTINLHNQSTVEDVKNAFMLAYETGCKGLTIYRDGSRMKQVLECKKPKIQKKGLEYIKPKKRPEKTYGVTYEMPTGCGSLYVTINEDGEGYPFEVFARLGKAGGCSSAQTEGLGRTTSLLLRSNVDPQEIVKQYKGISCDRQYGFGKNKILSCPDAIGKALEKYLKDKDFTEQKNIATQVKGDKPAERDTPLIANGACPECGSPVIRIEGCRRCISNCGYTECD